jgi:acyl-CoA reductase-like NAD-dependent aldehyde dehydrogenase
MTSVTAPAMTIGGESAEAEREIEVTNPATGDPFAGAPACSPEQLDAAFAAAAAAQPAWAADEEARRSALVALADAVVAAGDELTSLAVLETGKPNALAQVEIAASDAWLRYYAATDLARSVVSDDASARIEVRRRPVGVVAAIIPWNFPVGQAVWKIAPALRAGCTIVLKPSPFAPLAVLRLGELLGGHLPAGVVNVVSGDDELGAAMTAHPTPRKVTFTGSIGSGKQVATAAAPDLKRVTLELGGNDAAILLDDADVEVAARGVMTMATFNAGQVCAIPKRIYAPERIYDDAVEALAEVARGITLGSGAEGDMGPLTTKPQYERVSGLVAAAIADGARAASGGGPDGGPGYFFPPTVLAEARDGQPIVDEEQFGPALPVLRYRDVDEAVGRANATMYGLCGSVWGSDVERAQAVAERLECGVAYVNAHGDLPPQMPFGGAKWSGVGVENGYDGLLQYTQRQVVYTAAG